MRSGAPTRMAQALHTEHALAPFFDEYIISTIHAECCEPEAA